MAKWLIKNKKADISAMAQALGIDPIVARILVNRDVNTGNLVTQFLNPQLSMLADFCMMAGVAEAFALLKKSIEQQAKIYIYGDYDVDGVMSTTILYKGLKAVGADVHFYIPDRMAEGYGLNKNAVLALKEEGANLLITCDNGIASIDEIALARAEGIKSIIIDHHEPAYTIEGEQKIEILPDAHSLIDPKQKNCPYGFKNMCAAGLCFRFVIEFHRFMGHATNNYDELLIFAAIATICDIVDLNGDNRILAKNGLERLNSGRDLNLGLKSLIKEKSYQGKELGEFAVGFIIGPCINASGRLENAEMAVELFTTEDPFIAEAYAKKLSDLNEERKAMTLSAFKRISEEYEKNGTSADKVIVIYDEEIHESIAGIVAGRIKDRFHHPAVVLTKGEEMAKGSARSIEGYNIFEELSKCKHLFERFGGHAMAAGLSLKEENIDLLRTLLNDNCTLAQEDFDEIIRIDMALPIEDVTYTLAGKIKKLRPFGKANREPAFGTKNLFVSEIRLIEEKDTIIFTFLTENHRKLKGLAFGKYENFDKMIKEHFDSYDYDKIMNGMLRNVELMLDIIYYIDINEYNDTVSVQMNIKDFRIST